MLEMLAQFGQLLDRFADADTTPGRSLVQPLLAAVCLTVAEAAAYVSHEPGIACATRPGFLAMDGNPPVPPRDHAAPRLSPDGSAAFDIRNPVYYARHNKDAVWRHAVLDACGEAADRRLWPNRPGYRGHARDCRSWYSDVAPVAE
jgi:hypothetical protein